MEYFIGAISLVTLVLNYTIYRRITATYPLGSVEETELEPAHYCCCDSVIKYLETQSVVKEAHDPPAPTVVQDYGAWKNEREIPWVPPTKTPEPLNKPANRGPLARPDGFI